MGRTFNGSCESEDIFNGVEFTTDKDFVTLNDDDTLRITTANGRAYDLFGPEQGDLKPGITMQPRAWALLMPKIERVEHKRFRLVLTEAQEVVIKGT